MTTHAPKTQLLWVLLACCVGICVGAGIANLSDPVALPTVARQAGANPAPQMPSTAKPPATSFSASAMQAASASYRQAWELSKALDAVTPPKPAASKMWRIAGTTEVGGAGRAVVMFEGSAAPELRAPGDLLPGGAKILSIGNSYVEVLVGRQRLFLSVGTP